MRSKPFLISALTISSLAACGGGSTNPQVAQLFGIPAAAGGTFSVTMNGETFSPTGPSVVQSGFTDTFGTGGREGAAVFESSSVLAVAGHTNGDNYAGISGTTQAPPSGTADFVGSYYIYHPTFGRNNGSGVTFSYDPADNSITEDSNFIDLQVQVDAAGAVTGTFIHNPNTPAVRNEADLTGGFYASDRATQDFIAVFNSDTISGAINAER